MNLKIVFLLLFFAQIGFASAKQSDAVCFKYSFNKGDSLTYICASRDSIYIPGRETILRDRKETIAIVCDSISKDGLFRLSQTLQNIEIVESGNNIKNQIRYDAPWLGRKVWFWIDSAGARYNFGADDSMRAANSPGGAFQPNLIFAYNETCHNVKSSWEVDALVDLPENSIPAPRFKYYSLFRNLPKLDTLGEQCNAGQYTLTGQGSASVSDQYGHGMRLTSIIAQYGKFLWCKSIAAPLHFFATNENKFTIIFEGDSADRNITGKHYIKTNYTLVEARISGGRLWKLKVAPDQRQ